MDVVNIGSIKEFNSFLKNIYGNDRFYKDNKSSVTDIVCNKKSIFAKKTYQELIAVRNGSETLCQCALIHHPAFSDTLMAAFFEAEENAHDAFSLLCEHASDVGKKLGCSRLMFGIDGHCNNSIGFLSDGFGSYPCFGQSYNPEYYNDFFVANDFGSINFVSYYDRLDSIDMTTADYFTKRFGKSFVIQHADFGVNFKNTMHRYTILNNIIFKDHCYYFNRESDEDIELFKAMRPILRKENLIFASHNGSDVGFVLWYPDFNYFVPPGKSAGINAFLKYRLLGQKPPSVKIVEIGVIPGYENSGVILKLLMDVFASVREKYSADCNVISSWIYEENSHSKNLSRRFLKNDYKRFVVYERKI